MALTINTRLTGIKNLLYFTVKDKAEVLIEVERLRAVQAELTSELAALHTDLEKERSKNAQDPRTKDKVKYIFIMKFVAKLINKNLLVRFLVFCCSIFKFSIH